MESRLLTPQRERVSLFRHGTKSFTLTPNAIVDAALSDIRARQFNREVRAMRADKEHYPKGSEIRKQLPPLRKFAFLREHVAEHHKASEIISVALKDTTIANTSRDVETLMVYESEKKLRDALAIALARESQAA